MKRILPLVLFLSGMLAVPVQAQYFGRNKPRYQKQDFRVAQTEHFEIYHYLDNPEKLRELGAASELWYAMHQAVLRDTFMHKNPMIIYNDHAGFQQTNAIMGDIGVGTGGVTEGLRNRVIFPIAMTNQQTHHVLGHEMVHAFQYHMILQGDSTNMQNLANLPLWMVEGLAEYLSIGRIDAHTAMWMRDAVKNDDVPRFRDLNNFKYFPYRWGQAFWAFIAGNYGDAVIPDLFMNTAKYGLDNAIVLTLSAHPDSLSKAWQQTLRNHYGRWVTKGKKDDLPGKELVSKENFGRMNVSPVVSPNGKYMIFLSERNLFTTDLYLADARTGKIIRKVYSTATDGHTDQMNFIESSGTWSPDSKRFAFDVYEKGRSALLVMDVERRRVRDRIQIPGIPAFSNPAWSPDGKTIVVSGLVDGQVDLFSYNLKTKKATRLTNNRYAEIQPVWNESGTQIAFATDELSMERGRTNGAWVMNLAVLDVASGEVEQIDVFPGADNMNPQFDKTGNLFFLSNRDGFRNLYRYDVVSQKVYQLTKLSTGISGITPYAPAISVSENRERVLYTYYNAGSYSIYQAKTTDFLNEEVSATAVDQVAATLPPFDPRQRDMVNVGLRLQDDNTRKTEMGFTMRETKYKPKFSLEYLGGGAGGGIATGNSSFGTAVGLAGGVDMLFRDMLGNNQLYAGLALNGELADAAGQFSYINQKNRVNWGANVSHIPYRSGYYTQDFQLGEKQTLNGETYIGFRDELILQRIFQERLGLFTFYPLTVTRRIELGGAYEYYHQRVDRYVYYLAPNGAFLGQDRERLNTGASNFSMANVNAAYVGDNSYFGGTAPLQGWRYRLGVEQFFGAYNFTALLADGRRYFRARPFTLALRGLSYNRIGGNANNTDQVFPLFAGQPFFVRGYTSRVLSEDAPELVDQMAGSKIAVANAEIRLPFTGPRQLSLIPFPFLITDLNFFFDAGVGFFDFDDFNPEDPNPNDEFEPVKHVPLMSVGVSLRVNLFGALILEPYYALPLAVPAENRGWVLGLNIVPGW